MLQSVKNIDSLPKGAMSVDEFLERESPIYPAGSTPLRGGSPRENKFEYNNKSQDLSLALALESKSLEDSHGQLSFMGSVLSERL